MMNSYLEAKRQATSKRMEYTKKASIANRNPKDDDSFNSEMSFSSASIASAKKKLALLKQSGGVVGDSLIEQVKVDNYDSSLKEQYNGRSPQIMGAGRQNSSRFRSVVVEPQHNKDTIPHEHHHHHHHKHHHRKESSSNLKSKESPWEDSLKPNNNKSSKVLDSLSPYDKHKHSSSYIQETTHSPQHQSKKGSHHLNESTISLNHKSQHQKSHHHQESSHQQHMDQLPPFEDSNYLKIEKETLTTSEKRLRRAISHEHKNLPSQLNNTQQDSSLHPPNKNNEKIQKKNTLGGSNKSSRRPSISAMKKMSPAERSLHEGQLRDSITLFKGQITKMPYSNLKKDQAKLHESAPNPGVLHKQNSRTSGKSQKHKFSGAVIYDGDKVGSSGVFHEEILTDDEQGINSNRGLIQKYNPKTQKRRPIAVTPRSGVKLLLEEGQTGKQTQNSASHQDDQEFLEEKLNNRPRGNIEVYELDFVELKPSLQLENLRKSKDSGKKISKIMVKRRSSVFPNGEQISARGSVVSKKQENTGLLQSLMKTFNGGSEPPGIEKQDSLPKVLIVQDAPKENKSKAQLLMEALMQQKQKELTGTLKAKTGPGPQKFPSAYNLTSGHTELDHKDLRFWEAGGIKFTMDYINHLNHVYKMMGQQTKIKRNTAVMVPEEDINIQEQENREYTEEMNRRKRCSRLQKKFPFLRQFIRWFKNKFYPQQEEWERDQVSEDDSQIVEDLEIKAPDDTSGESEQDENLEVQYADMTKYQQDQRVLELWRRTAAKAVGGGRIVKIFNELSDQIAMFGVSRRIAVTVDEDIKPLRIILMPDNKFRMAWNIITMLLLLYTASFVPYRTSFIDVAPNGLVIWEWIVDALFIIDIFINFVSAFENQDKNIEVRLKVIASTYIQSWFLFDLTAVFPFQLLENSDVDSLMQAENSIDQTNVRSGTAMYDPFNQSQAQSGQNPFVTELYNIAKFDLGGNNERRSNQNINKLIRLARLPRLYRLMRIVRLFKIFSLLKNNASFKRLQETINLNVGVQRILVISLVVMFMVHLMACIFFLVSKFEDEDTDNWAIYAGINDEIDSYQYLVCLYWALQTLTTVGYGDVTPRSAAEKVTGLIWMIIGVGFYSFTIGNLASIFNSIDIKAAQLQQKLAVLAEFSKRTHLPEELQNRVKRFLENNHGDHLSLSDQKQLLADVPASLRAEVVSHTHKEIIKRIKFLSDKDAPFLFTILPLLKPMKVYPKDTLYQQGDYAEEVFFIFQGRIKLYIDLNEAGEGETMNVPFNLYVEGSYFGDSDIFPNPNQEGTEDERNQRDCTAIAEVESSLLVITRKELVDVFKRFKDIAKEMKSIGYERKKHHQKAINAILDKNREKIIMQKLAKALASSRLVRKKAEPEEDKQTDEKKSFFFGFKDTDSQKESVRQGQVMANQKLRMKQKLITKDPQEEILQMLQAISGGPITMDLKKKKELMSAKSPKKKNASTTDESSTPSAVNSVPKNKKSSINVNQGSLNSIEEEEEELRAASSLSDDNFGSDDRHKLASHKDKQKEKNTTPSKPHLEHKQSRKPSSSTLPKSFDRQTTNLRERRGSQMHKLSNRNLQHVMQGSNSLNGSVEFADRSISKMDVEDIMVNDDMQWKLNEEIMNEFQENMALIAGNSFEILQLYLMIQEDYSKVTDKIEKTEQAIDEIASKSINLEVKLTQMMNLI